MIEYLERTYEGPSLSAYMNEQGREGWILCHACFYEPMSERLCDYGHWHLIFYRHARPRTVNDEINEIQTMANSGK